MASAFDLAAIVADARERLRDLARSLPREHVPAARRNAARASARVPDAALELAADILERRGPFGPVEPATIRDALTYAAAMRPLVAELRQLADQLAATTLARRAGAAQATSFLYNTLRLGARIGKGDAMELRELRKLLTTKTRQRATTLNAKDDAAIKRELRAKKKAAAKLADAAKAQAAADAAAKRR